jgi:hypothetical protein
VTEPTKGRDDVGGLGALAESARDAARLRAEITAIWQAALPGCDMDGEAP